MPFSRDLPHPEIKPTSLLSPVLAGRFFIASITWETPRQYIYIIQKVHGVSYEKSSHLHPLPFK